MKICLLTLLFLACTPLPSEQYRVYSPNIDPAPATSRGSLAIWYGEVINPSGQKWDIQIERGATQIALPNSQLWECWYTEELENRRFLVCRVYASAENLQWEATVSLPILAKLSTGSDYGCLHLSGAMAGTGHVDTEPADLGYWRVCLGVR